MICPRDVTGHHLPHSLLLLHLKLCEDISFRTPFEELTYFLLISNGIIQNRHISIFTLVARKLKGNLQTNESNHIGSRIYVCMYIYDFHCSLNGNTLSLHLL